MEQHIRAIRELDQKLEGYSLGLKHGISLAELDHHYRATIKEIEDFRKLLKEKHGQERGPQGHEKS